MNMITAEQRDLSTKAKQLRNRGIIPCVIYGGNLKESLPIQIATVTASKLFRDKRVGSRLKIEVDNQVIPVQIKYKERNSLTNEILHIDFQAIKEDQKLNSVIHILLANTDKVAGVLDKMMMEIPYSSYPDDMIDTITLDLDGIAVGTVITLADIPQLQTDKIELQTDKDNIVIRISDKKSAPLQEAES